MEIHDTGHGDGVKNPEELDEIRNEKQNQNAMEVGHRGR